MPDVPLIGEEGAASDGPAAIGSTFLLVDPLDGTKEFISRNGEFTVNIAEIVEGKPVRGVVHAPAKERLFFGEMLSGAYEAFAPPGGAPDFGEARRIQARPVPKDGLIAVASRSHRDAETDKYLARFPVKEFVSAGSSLKFCLVAAGEADIYPRTGRTMEWDTGAGHAVLAAAGGSVTQLDGKPFLYGKSERGYDNPFFVARGVV
jgi:3'(2'), 5'-bisphosphate nucleotidase